MCHPLQTVFTQTAAGRHPAPDGGLRVLTPPDERSHGVFAFTGHNVVVADVAADWVAGRLPDGDLSAPLSPRFLVELEAATGRQLSNIDLVLVAHAAPRRPGGMPDGLVEAAGSDHARVARAERYRTGVRVWTCDGGLVLLGRGVAGRWEVAVEVSPPHRGRGLGRALFEAVHNRWQAFTGPGTRLGAKGPGGSFAALLCLRAAVFPPLGAELLLSPPRRW